MFATAIHSLPQLSYFGLFLFLLGGAFFLPIPEEITLLTAGYLVAQGVISIWLGLALSIAGLFLGDIILFFLARLGSNFAKKLRERVNKMGLERTWIFSPQQPLRAVFILRFLTGFRFIAPIYAGFEQVSWDSYTIVDLLAIVIYTPIMFFLGYEFHASILAFIAGFEIIRHAIFVAVLALAGVGMLPELWHRVKNRKKAQDEQSVPQE